MPTAWPSSRTSPSRRSTSAIGASGAGAGQRHQPQRLVQRRRGCPEGDPWYLEIPCVGLYTINGFYTCSGGMMNNTAQDQRPFFLTADHCGVTSGNDQSMVVIWNFENSIAESPDQTIPAGTATAAPTSTRPVAAILRASSSSSDFCLVELNNDPNPNYGVTFCGWSRQTSAASSAVGIHHPNLDEKRISFDNNSLSSDGNYWRVNNWELGTTSSGSSAHCSSTRTTGSSVSCSVASPRARTTATTSTERSPPRGTRAWATGSMQPARASSTSTPLARAIHPVPAASLASASSAIRAPVKVQEASSRFRRPVRRRQLLGRSSGWLLHRHGLFDRDGSRLQRYVSR